MDPVEEAEAYYRETLERCLAYEEVDERPGDQAFALTLLTNLLEALVVWRGDGELRLRMRDIEGCPPLVAEWATDEQGEEWLRLRSGSWEDVEERYG